MSDFVTDMEHEMKPKLPANTSEGFPRYQLSKFLAGSKDYQIVVRANSQEEFEEAMKEIKPFIMALEGNLHTPKTTSTPQNDVMARHHQNDTGFCQTHQVQMQEKNGSFGPYYSHIIQDVGYCNGKKITPFKKNI